VPPATAVNVHVIFIAPANAEVLGLEFDQLHDPRVRNQLEEPSTDDIRVFRGLAGC
jgi:hypothetical protein